MYVKVYLDEKPEGYSATKRYESDDHYTQVSYGYDTKQCQPVVLYRNGHLNLEIVGGKSTFDRVKDLPTLREIENVLLPLALQWVAEDPLRVYGFLLKLTEHSYKRGQRDGWNEHVDKLGELLTRRAGSIPV